MTANLAGFPVAMLKMAPKESICKTYPVIKKGFT